MAERAEARERRAVLDIAAVSGLPEAQRDADSLIIVPTGVDGKPRPIVKTVRKLTRVEKLVKRSVLTRDEGEACEWYAELHATAWDTTKVTADYEGGGGRSGSAFASHPAMAKSQLIANARSQYASARGAIPERYAGVFEAIVCRNEMLGMAALMFGDVGNRQGYNLVQTALKVCAVAIGEVRAGAVPNERRRSLVAAMMRFDERVRVSA